MFKNVFLTHKGIFSILHPLKSYCSTTVRQKFSNYIGNIVSDYNTSLKDLLVSIKERPIRSFVASTFLTSVVACSFKKPNFNEYKSRLLNSALDIWSVPKSHQNKISLSYIDNILNLEAQNKLRYIDFFILNVIWEDEHCKENCVYKCICPNTQVSYFEISSRIIDWGFWGRFPRMEEAMLEFDVNEEEWSDATDDNLQRQTCNTDHT